MEKIVEKSRKEIESIFKMYLEENGLGISSIKYTSGQLVAYISEQDEKIDGLIGKIRIIVECKPVQVKMILKKHFEPMGILIRNIKFSVDSATLHVNDMKVVRAKKKKYRNQTFLEIGCSTKICNCLKSISVETIGQLESYFKEHVAPESTAKNLLRSINGMGKGSCNELEKILGLRNLRITDKGLTAYIS